MSDEIDEVDSDLQARLIGNAEGMRQGDTITVRRIALLKSLRADVEALPAGTEKTILAKIVMVLALLEKEIDFWSD